MWFECQFLFFVLTLLVFFSDNFFKIVRMSNDFSKWYLLKAVFLYTRKSKLIPFHLATDERWPFIFVYTMCKTIKNQFILENNCFEWNHNGIQCDGKVEKSVLRVLLLFCENTRETNEMLLCPRNRKKWKSVWNLVWLTKRSEISRLVPTK